MNYVVKAGQKVCVKTRHDAITLMRALNENGCTESLSRQEIIGKEGNSAFEISFDMCEDSISVCGQEDAEAIAHWLLDLNVKEVNIKRNSA